MNLFENIFNTAKSGLSSYNKYMGEVGSNLYDAQQNVQLKQQGNVIQSFLNQSKAKPEMQSKRNAVVQMIQNGEDDSFIQNTITQKMGYDASVGVGDRIASALGNRLQTAGESYMQDKSGIEKGLSAVKDVIATPFDVIGAVAQPVIQPIVDTAMETPYLGTGIRKAGEAYGSFRASNPRLAQNIEAVGGIASAVVPFTKTGQAVIKAPGRAIVRGTEAVVPKVATIIKKPVSIIANKAKDVFGKEVRPVQDIAGNILQPYKGMVENLDDATSGLRRVVDETGASTDTFDGLLSKIEQTQTKYGQMKQEALGQITQTRKSVSAQKALENLDNVYVNVSSKDMLVTQSRVKQLAQKNMNEGLTPLEMDEVKILHTKSNNLFNEKGQQTGGFSSDDMRGIRRDLKNEIEEFAEANGVSNIREINRVYGEVSDARTLAQNQVDNLTSYKGRQIPATRIQKIADFVMEFPVIKQAFADPARILASSIFKTLRGDKINPIEVQKRLPSFLKELQDAGMKAGDLQKVEKMIKSEIKLIPARTESSIQPRGIPLGRSQAEIIADSKKGLSPNISRQNGNSNNNRTTPIDNSTKVIKPSPKAIVPKKTENTPIVKKSTQSIQKERLTEEISGLDANMKNRLIESRTRTYEEALSLYEKTKSTLAKNQLNQALRDIKELNPDFNPKPVAPKSIVKEGGVKTWEELNKNNPDLFEKGILRRSQSPMGVSKEDFIPKNVHKTQHTWQHYGQYDEFPASRIYDKKMHKYIDENGKYIEDSQGNILEDVWNAATQEWTDATIKNSDIRNNLLEIFKTQEGANYLKKVISALPKDKDGYITAYRIGDIRGDGVQSYTLSEGMAKTFSNVGTDIIPSMGMKSGGYKEFGKLPHSIVKIDPKGIEAWSPYDAEILVSPKYVTIKNQPIIKPKK